MLEAHGLLNPFKANSKSQGKRDSMSRVSLGRAADEMEGPGYLNPMLGNVCAAHLPLFCIIFLC